MIISKIQGGLGNQLFQCSLGRYLSFKNKTEFKLDITWFGQVPDRPFELNKFNISASLAKPEEIARLKTSAWFSFLRRHPRNMVVEKNFQFDPVVVTTGPEAYLDGYWQSEKYFLPIAGLIRKEFTLKAKPTGLNLSLLNKIKGSQAVSLHVRRGDYVSNKTHNQFHGTCSLEYYQQAVQYISSKISKPHFFIFSDDPDWTQKNLKINQPVTFVSHNGKAAEEDLRLMSQCQHFIIANSTFSWWGAWLAANPDKIVIAPKQWFNDPTKNTSDLIPQTWIRI